MMQLLDKDGKLIKPSEEALGPVRAAYQEYTRQMEEKPLHVRVAEALGWKQVPVEQITERECGGTEFWRPPGQNFGSYCLTCKPDALPRYDTDWSATGPLIEKYGITVQCIPKHWIALGEPTIGGELNGCGDTTLRAVCDLLELAFHPSFGGLKPRT